LSTHRNFSSAIGAALIALLALLGCKRGSGVHKVGETAVQSDYKFTVLGVKLCELNEAEKYTMDRNKKEAVGVEVILEPTADNIVFSPPNAIASDGSGGEYTGAVFATCEPELKPQFTKLTAHGKYRGFITFHVPVKTPGLRLKFSPPRPFGEQPVEFDLKL
jgi:hypothetical protein